MFGNETRIEKEKVINTSNYKLAFSYVDKGVPLYYFNCYQPKKLTSRLQVIDAFSYGVELYIGVNEKDYV